MSVIFGRNFRLTLANRALSDARSIAGSRTFCNRACGV